VIHLLVFQMTTVSAPGQKSAWPLVPPDGACLAWMAPQQHLAVDVDLPVYMASISAQLSEFRRDLESNVRRIDAQNTQAEHELARLRARLLMTVQQLRGSKRTSGDEDVKQAVRLGRLLQRLDMLEEEVGQEQSECISMLEVVLSTVGDHHVDTSNAHRDCVTQGPEALRHAVSQHPRPAELREPSPQAPAAPGFGGTCHSVGALTPPLLGGRVVCSRAEAPAPHRELGSSCGVSPVSLWERPVASPPRVQCEPVASGNDWPSVRLDVSPRSCAASTVIPFDVASPCEVSRGSNGGTCFPSPGQPPAVPCVEPSCRASALVEETLSLLGGAEPCVPGEQPCSEESWRGPFWRDVVVQPCARARSSSVHREAASAPFADAPPVSESFVARDAESAVMSASVSSGRPAESCASVHDTGYVWASRGVTGSVVHSPVASQDLAREDQGSHAEVTLDATSSTSQSRSSAASKLPMRPCAEIVTQASPVCHTTKRPSAHTKSAVGWDLQPVRDSHITSGGSADVLKPTPQRSVAASLGGADEPCEPRVQRREGSVTGKSDASRRQSSAANLSTTHRSLSSAANETSVQKRHSRVVDEPRMQRSESGAADEPEHQPSSSEVFLQESLEFQERHPSAPGSCAQQPRGILAPGAAEEGGTPQIGSNSARNCAVDLCRHSDVVKAVGNDNLFGDDLGGTAVCKCSRSCSSSSVVQRILPLGIAGEDVRRPLTPDDSSEDQAPHAAPQSSKDNMAELGLSSDGESSDGDSSDLR